MIQKDLSTGLHEFKLDSSESKELSPGNYVIHLKVENRFGLFTKAKLMSKI